MYKNDPSGLIGTRPNVDDSVPVGSDVQGEAPATVVAQLVNSSEPSASRRNFPIVPLGVPKLPPCVNTLSPDTPIAPGFRKTGLGPAVRHVAVAESACTQLEKAVVEPPVRWKCVIPPGETELRYTSRLFDAMSMPTPASGMPLAIAVQPDACPPVVAKQAVGVGTPVIVFSCA